MQIATRSVTLKSVLRNKQFHRGIRDYQRGRAPEFDELAAGRDTNVIWSYERGRLFAAWARGKGLAIPRAYNNRRLTWDFLGLAKKAFFEGAFR